MKKFTDQTLNLNLLESELAKFKHLLDNASIKGLEERKHILPFVKASPNLSLFIGFLVPYINKPEKLAFEFDLFGDFKVDMAIGDPTANKYCFIEFEDATPKSHFVSKKGKYKPDFSSRLEHGFSQIVDWFNKIEGLRHSNELKDRFGNSTFKYEGILIIGRDRYLDASQKQRLEWRTDKTKIDSKTIYFYTFDQLYNALLIKLNFYKQATL